MSFDDIKRLQSRLETIEYLKLVESEASHAAAVFLTLSDSGVSLEEKKVTPDVTKLASQAAWLEKAARRERERLER